jgi:lysophospholipase L1-like esterase
MLRRNSQTESPTGSPLRAVSVKRKVLYASVTLLLFLGGAELAARLFSDSESGRFRQISEIVSFLSAEESTQILEADAETFWKLRPNVVIDQPKSILFQGRVSNSLGYRNEELTLARPETTTRIVCFGDSSTFGIGTPQSETWPTQLETSLNSDAEFLQTQLPAASPSSLVEVINAGVPGYTSYQILQRMRRELKSLAPDVVLLTCANNDFWRWDNRTDVEQAKQLAGSSLRNTLMLSRGLQLADEWYSKWNRKTPQSDSEWARKASLNYFEPEEAWTPRVPLAEFEANLQQMAVLCEEQNVPLIFVIWPDQLQAAGKWSVRVAYHDAMLKVASERELLIADVATAFRQRPWSVRCYIPDDIVHVNAEGNRIAAEAARNALDRIFPPATTTQQLILPAGFVDSPPR